LNVAQAAGVHPKLLAYAARDNPLLAWWCYLVLQRFRKNEQAWPDQNPI